MSPYLHHVGIIVPNEARVGELMALLQLEEQYRGYVARWQALCIFTRSPLGSPLEFVVPDGGVLTEYNRGIGGLHHVALAVDSLAAVAKRLEAKNMRLLEDEPVKGAGPFLCNFLNPIYTRGILVEFVEELKGA